MWKRCLAFCRYRCRADTLWSFIRSWIFAPLQIQLLEHATELSKDTYCTQRHAHKQRSASWIYTPTSYILWAVSRHQIFFLSCGPSDRDSHVISICFETIFTWSFLNRWCGFLHSLTVHWTGKCANNLHKFKYCSAKKWQHLNLNRLNIKKSYYHVVCFVFPFFSLAGYVWTSTNIWIFGKDSSFWLKYITHQIKPLHPEKTTRD